ncbi:MAG: hypothetical protein IPH43_11510 [Xanthomonadales bacterium]|nr:hypothetical protein [Xanthomonadales bacterium]
MSEAGTRIGTEKLDCSPAVAGLSSLVPAAGAPFVVTENEYSEPQSSDSPAGAVQVRKPPAELKVQSLLLVRSPSLNLLEMTLTPAGKAMRNRSKPLLLTTSRFGSAPAVTAREKSRLCTA